MHNLLNNAKFIALNATAAAGTDGAVTATTVEIDTLGYAGCLVVFKLGAIAASGVFTAFLKNSATTATYGAGTIDKIGSSLVNDADTDDNKFVVFDVRRPQRRFIQPYYQRTVGNVTIESAFAILYNPVAPSMQPVSSTEVEASSILSNPTPSTT